MAKGRSKTRERGKKSRNETAKVQGTRLLKSSSEGIAVVGRIRIHDWKGKKLVGDGAGIVVLLKRKVSVVKGRPVGKRRFKLSYVGQARYETKGTNASSKIRKSKLREPRTTEDY